MFDEEFNDYLEENSPLQELLKEKLINIYRDKNIEELRTIIIEIEMKNLSLLKEIENLKFNLMKIKQELIDAKNSQKLINKNNLNNIENFNQFYVDNFNKDLRMDNEDLIKKELSIKYDENEYEFNELFNNSNNFDELKINPKILNKYVDNNDMKNFIYEISNEYNNKNNINNNNINNNNNYDNNDNLGLKMQEIKNYLRDFKNLKFNSNKFNNFSNINNNKQYKIPYKNNNKNFSPKNNSNFIKINQNNNNNFNEKEFENYSHSQLNSLNSINSQQINNRKEQIHSKQNSQLSNNSNRRFNTLPNKNNLNLLNDANPFNENNKNKNNSKKMNSQKSKDLNNNLNLMKKIN